MPDKSLHMISPIFSTSRHHRRSILANGVFSCLAISLWLAAGSGSVQAQRNLTKIPDPTPAKQAESLKAADGLELNLWASDPMIAKPIQIAWDAKGRMWAATSAIYPQVKPGQAADDKIMIVEDTDGDGKADRAKAFCENLLIPTGVWPAIDAELPVGHPGRYNAAYLANSTELVFARDTNGDGVMDERRTLLAGFGTEDTHHILHMIKGMPDGLLYFVQSVYIHTHMETAFGTRRMLGSGIWQMDTLTGQAETFSLGQVNPWGHVWNRWGQGFTTDGAYGEGVNHTFPGATFRCLPDQRPRILKGLNPGQPKQCGLEIISGSHFPDDWQGNMITNDFRGHRVNRFALTPEGSSYNSRQMPDVITSDHGAFRPVDVRMGPDGALYFADWYNPIIQHGEVDFRDDRRDKKHGRVWRVSAKGRPVCKMPDIPAASPEALLDLLLVKEEWVRNWAKWELKARFSEKPDTFAPVLEKWLANADPKNAEHAEKLLEGLWTRQALAFSPADQLAAATKLAASSEPNARAAAMRALGTMAVQARVLPSRRKELPVLAEAAAAGLKDAHPLVRQEAVGVLRQVGTPQAVEKAMAALDLPVDTNIDYILWLTAWELADTWLPALGKGEITFGGKVEHLAFALKSANRPQGSGILVELLKSQKLNATENPAILQLISENGRSEDLTYLFALASDDAVATGLRARLLSQLEVAAAKRKVRPSGDLSKLMPLLSAGDAAMKTAAARLAAAWKLEAARPSLEILARSGDSAGLDGLAMLGGPEAAKVFQEILSGNGPTKIKALCVAAQAEADAKTAATSAAGLLAASATVTNPAPADYLPAIEAFLARKDGPKLLAEALKDSKIAPAVATAALQRTGQSGGDTKALQEALTAAGSLQPMVQELSDAQMAELVKEVAAKGDPVRGEVVYRRAELTCIVCHAIGNPGGVVGPNLVSLGSSAPVDYIVESLLAPSKKIKEGYATTLLTTKAGEVHTGFLARADDKEIILRDAAGTNHKLAAGDIAKQENIPLSLMPPGLTSSLRRDEFVDLVRFLSELGKEGPYKTTGEGILRRWRSLQNADSLQGLVNKDGWKALGTVNDAIPWAPLYSFVNGELPMDAVPKLQVFIHKTSAAQSEIDVTKAGKIAVKLSAPANIKVLFGTQEVAMENGTATAELPTGTHKITLIWDHSQAVAERLTAELVPVDGGGNAKPVGGL